MNIAALLVKSAQAHAARPALSVGTQLYASYGSMAHQVAALAHGLRQQRGLGAGERVAIAMSNCPAFYEALFAIWHAGLVAVPINAKLHAREMAYILGHAQARLCFASAELALALRQWAPAPAGLVQIVASGSEAWHALAAGPGAELAEVAPDDAAWLFYTSGTTGRPKGAILTHRNLLAMTLSYFADLDPVDAGDCIIHAAPMSHGSGLYGLPHIARGANQVLPAASHFDPDEIWRLVAHYPGATLFAAPTMVRRLIHSPDLTDTALSHLKTIIYGGAPMYRADLELALALVGPRLAQIYGQGESPMTISALSKRDHAAREHPLHEALLGSVGYPRTGVELRVVDANGTQLAPGQTGEIVVRGDVVMAGYWRDPEASALALRGGWLHTGDLGQLHADGFLTLIDRAKDVLISGGSNIYPREVEEVLLRHPAVRQAAVIGAVDAEWGEQVVALVVLAAGAPDCAAELDALCLGQIARFKRPKRYHFVAALPTSDNGKVLKSELRTMLRALEAPAT